MKNILNFESFVNEKFASDEIKRDFVPFLQTKGMTLIPMKPKPNEPAYFWFVSNANVKIPENFHTLTSDQQKKLGTLIEDKTGNNDELLEFAENLGYQA